MSNINYLIQDFFEHLTTQMHPSGNIGFTPKEADRRYKSISSRAKRRKQYSIPIKYLDNKSFYRDSPVMWKNK